MKERVECEFALVRYVPDVARGEFANIGVVVREAGTEARAVQFTRDWRRVRCLDEDADLPMLEALEAELGRAGDRRLMELLGETLSNGVQIGAFQGCLAESLPAELEQLMRIYVDPPAVAKGRRAGQSGRTGLLRSMRGEFERARVWELMRKRIQAAEYTEAGDPMVIDCGYRQNGEIRMFQAVSLRGEAEAAKVLAYTAPRLREGVRGRDGAELELTAVVEPIADISEEQQARYHYGVGSMEREGIRVLTVRDVPRVAERARQDFHL